MNSPLLTVLPQQRCLAWNKMTLWSPCPQQPEWRADVSLGRMEEQLDWVILWRTWWWLEGGRHMWQVPAGRWKAKAGGRSPICSGQA
jgi:hypothetical protein